MVFVHAPTNSLWIVGLGLVNWVFNPLLLGVTTLALPGLRCYLAGGTARPEVLLGRGGLPVLRWDCQLLLRVSRLIYFSLWWMSQNKKGYFLFFIESQVKIYLNSFRSFKIWGQQKCKQLQTYSKIHYNYNQLNAAH